MLFFGYHHEGVDTLLHVYYNSHVMWAIPICVKFDIVGKPLPSGILIILIA